MRRIKRLLGNRPKVFGQASQEQTWEDVESVLFFQEERRVDLEIDEMQDVFIDDVDRLVTRELTVDEIVVHTKSESISHYVELVAPFGSPFTVHYSPTKKEVRVGK